MQLIAYIRESTADADPRFPKQLEKITDYAQEHDAEVVERYWDFGIATDYARPKLKEAVGHAARVGATLVVASLDRLSDDRHFIAGLMVAVEIVSCEPNEMRELGRNVSDAYAARADDASKNERTT